MYGRDPCEKEREEENAKPEEVDAEEFENSGINISKAAGIRIIEVAMGHIAVKNALRALAKGTVVTVIPALIEIYSQVNSGEQPDEQKNQHVQPSCGDAFRHVQPVSYRSIVSFRIRYSEKVPGKGFEPSAND